MVTERRTKAGTTIGVCQYRKAGNHKGKREKKGNETSQAQKEGNLRRATMNLTWLLNTNFRDGDILVTLDYKKENSPKDSERMNKDFTNFYDRLKRRMKKAGKAPPKYIRVVEVGPKGGRHHHFVMQEIELADIRECWKAGGVHVDPLYTDGNYRKIAEYFVKYAKKTMDTEGKLSKKLWYPSRGLKKPKVGKQKDIKSRDIGQVRVPKGYYLDQESVKHGMSRYDGHETFFYILVRIPGYKRRKKGKCSG